MGCLSTGQVALQADVQRATALAEQSSFSYFAGSGTFNGIPNSTRFHTNLLAEPRASLVFSIAKKLSDASASTFSVYDAEVTKSEAQALQAVIGLDFPELLGLGPATYLISDNKVSELRFERLGTQVLAYYQENIDKAVRKVKELVKGLETLAAAFYIYDFLLYTVHYTPDASIECSTAICISTRQGNGLGLAAAFSYLCQKCSVVCLIVYLHDSYNRLKSVNEICVSGQWGVVDCGAAAAMFDGEAVAVYFGLSDEYLAKYTAEHPKPCCATFALSTIARNGGLIRDENELYAACAYVAQAYQKGAQYVDLLCSSTRIYGKIQEISRSLLFGACRHLTDLDLDLTRSQVKILPNVSCARMELLRGKKSRVMKAEIVELNWQVICAIADCFNSALSLGVTAVVLCFGLECDFKELSAQLSERMQKIVYMIRSRRDIGEYFVLSDEATKVVQISL